MKRRVTMYPLSIDTMIPKELLDLWLGVEVSDVVETISFLFSYVISVDNISLVINVGVR